MSRRDRGSIHWVKVDAKREDEEFVGGGGVLVVELRFVLSSSCTDEDVVVRGGVYVSAMVFIVFEPFLVQAKPGADARYCYVGRTLGGTSGTSRVTSLCGGNVPL